jgi:hypothetical protein
MIPKTSAVLIFFVLLIPEAARAQAWTRDQGRGYVNVSVTEIAGRSVFGGDFQQHPIGNTYRQLTIGFYGELGIIDRWLMATVSSEIYRRNQLDAQGRTDGLGDTRVGLWSGLITSPFRLSVGLVADLPTGDSAPSAGSGASQDATLIARSLPTGNGRFDLEPSAALGYTFGGRGTFWPLEHYTVLFFGYAPRTRGFADGISYRIELGTRLPLTFVDRFLFIARIFGIESFASKKDAALASFSGLGNGVTYTALSLELYGRIYESLGLSISKDTAFRARGLIAAGPIKVALSYEF